MRKSFEFLSTGTKFSSSNWPVLIDTSRTQITVLRDNLYESSLNRILIRLDNFSLLFLCKTDLFFFCNTSILAITLFVKKEFFPLLISDIIVVENSLESFS